MIKMTTDDIPKEVPVIIAPQNLAEPGQKGNTAIEGQVDPVASDVTAVSDDSSSSKTQGEKLGINPQPQNGEQQQEIVGTNEEITISKQPPGENGDQKLPSIAATEHIENESRKRKPTGAPEATIDFHDVANSEIKSPLAFQGDTGMPTRKDIMSRNMLQLQDHVKDAFLARYNEPESSVDAFGLEYNECSIASIGRWANMSSVNGKKDSKTKQKQFTNTVFHTVPVLFRKCHICQKYGHYEIECTSMTEDNAVDLAERAEEYSIRNELREKKKKTRHFSPFRYLGLEEKGIQTNYDPAVDEMDTDLSLVCQVCRSGIDADNVLICDGCNNLSHLYCLTPPLTEVPQGDWFCKVCKDRNLDVSSDVEIEVCNDFVIEQRKNRRTDMLDIDWKTATTMIPEIPQVNGSVSTCKIPTDFKVEKERVLDGFTISLSSTSACPKVLDRLASARDNVNKEIWNENLTTGCLVAWFSSSSKMNNGEDSNDPSIGVILAADSETNNCLVRKIDEWGTLVNDQNGETVPLEESLVRTVQTGGSFWYPAAELHLVARAPVAFATDAFNNDIVPSRIAAGISSTASGYS